MIAFFVITLIPWPIIVPLLWYSMLPELETIHATAEQQEEMERLLKKKNEEKEL